MEQFDDSDVEYVDSDPEDQRVMVDSMVDVYDSGDDATTIMRWRRQQLEGPKKPEPGWIVGLVRHPVSVAARERVAEGVAEGLASTRQWGEGMARGIVGQWRGFRDEGGFKMVEGFLNYDRRFRH